MSREGQLEIGDPNMMFMILLMWGGWGGVLVGDRLSTVRGDSAVCVSSFQNP